MPNWARASFHPLNKMKMELLLRFVFCVVALVLGVRSNELCEPAVDQLVQRGVASPEVVDQLPSNGSDICGGGPCCTPSVVEHLPSRGRHLLHAIVQRETTSLLERVTSARDAFRSTMDEALASSERRSLDSFRRLYPRLVGHVKEPLRELFASLRSSLSTSDEGTVERALSNFWDNLFPLVYHSTVHSRLPPFSHGYMECLRKSRRSINPWKVVPSLIGESLSKGLDTARLLIHTLNVGSDVVLNVRNYQIPDECGPPAARLHFCAACHGALVPPCSGLCLNVARGCLAPLAEIDGAWAELGTAANRIEESIKNSDLAHLMKGLPDRFSDAIMVAMESGTKLQKMVRSKCGPYSHENSEDWEAKSNEGFLGREELSSSSAMKEDPDSIGRLMELKASEAAQVLNGSRNFWVGLADGACAHLSAQYKNCWNGLKVAAYSRPAAGVGISAQKYNPEVQVQKSDVTIYPLVEQLRAVKRVVTKQLTWMPESDSFRHEDPANYEGSGTDGTQPNFKNLDDEDAEDDGMGSGFGPQHKEEAHSNHDLEAVPTATQGSSQQMTSSLLFGSVVSFILLINLRKNL